MNHLEYLLQKRKYTIGDKVHPYGTIYAIIWSGERMYMFMDENKTVSLIPALCLPEKS